MRSHVCGATQIVRNQSGQALLTVLIAAGIGTMVALGTASTMVYQQLGVNNLKFRTDSNNFNEEVRALLSSSAACANSFGGLVTGPGSTLDIPTLFDDSPSPGAPAFSTGDTYGDRSLILNSMSLGDYQAGGTPGSAKMTLLLSLTTAKQSMGAQQVARTINISLQVNAANKIVSCIALAKMSDGIWTRSQANPNNIFFNGNVALGMGAGTHVFETLSNNSQERAITSDFFATPAAPWGGAFLGQTARGSAAAPSATLAGDGLASFTGAAYDGTAFVPQTTTPGMYVTAAENWSALNHGSRLDFATINNGSLAGSYKMSIDQNGNVGIGTTVPGQKLQVGSNGDGSVAVANAWTTFSDARLKNVISRIPRACEIVDQLNGYYYTWKNAADQSRQVGVIAQEVEAVLPELVKTGSDGIKMVDYPKLAAVLIESSKEHNREIESLKAETAQLKKENAALKVYLCAKDPRATICR